MRLEKLFDPATDTGRVDFTQNGVGDDNAGTGYGHGGVTAFKNAPLPDNTASEAGHTGTDLGDYVSDWSCSNGKSGTGASITAADNLDLAYGDKVTCTFTNHRKARIIRHEVRRPELGRLEGRRLGSQRLGDPGLQGRERQLGGGLPASTTVDHDDGSRAGATALDAEARHVRRSARSVRTNWTQTKPNPGDEHAVPGNVSAAPGGYVLTVGYGSVVSDKDFGNAGFGSGSTMTDSAFRLVDDLAPWTIGDFEILINSQNTIVATNPGQFYYHQRATNTSGATNVDAVHDQLAVSVHDSDDRRRPAHPRLRAARRPTRPNTWRDWTPQSSNITWTNTNTSPACIKTIVGRTRSAPGRSRRMNVPAGAKVWVTVHLDYSLKDDAAARATTSATRRSCTRRSSRPPRRQAARAISSTSLLGRGKKVTVVYGRTTNKAGGAPMADVWMKLTQGSNTALARSPTVDGSYVFYDGQQCIPATGCRVAAGASTSAWTFANGGNVSTKLDVLGDDGLAPAGESGVPGGQVRRSRCSAAARRSPPSRARRCRATRSASPRAARTTATGSSARRTIDGWRRGERRDAPLAGRHTDRVTPDQPAAASPRRAVAVTGAGLARGVRRPLRCCSARCSSPPRTWGAAPPGLYAGAVRGCDRPRPPGRVRRRWRPLDRLALGAAERERTAGAWSRSPRWRR